MSVTTYVLLHLAVGAAFVAVLTLLVVGIARLTSTFWAYTALLVITACLGVATLLLVLVAKGVQVHGLVWFVAVNSPQLTMPEVYATVGALIGVPATWVLVGASHLRRRVAA